MRMSVAWRPIPLIWIPCHFGKIHPSKDEEALVKNKNPLHVKGCIIRLVLELTS